MKIVTHTFYNTDKTGKADAVCWVVLAALAVATVVAAAYTLTLNRRIERQERQIAVLKAEVYGGVK